MAGDVDVIDKCKLKTVHLLERRKGIRVEKVRGVEQATEAQRVDMRGSQPSPGNMAGGLSTIAEKSLERSVNLAGVLSSIAWNTPNRPCGPAFRSWIVPVRIWLRLRGL